MRRGVIIHNPRSGRADAAGDLELARAHLADSGWSIEIRRTAAPGDAGRLAGEAVQAGLDAALIAGGDGTLNEAINALVGTPVAVGALPTGTANVWARQIGLPHAQRGILDAARRLADAHVRAIDVGRVTIDAGTPDERSRYFLLWSGLGIDAHVTRRLEPRPTWAKRLGVIGYSLAAMRASLTYGGAQVEIEIDGRRLSERATLVVVSNVRLYAGYFLIAPEALLDDGQLDVCILRGKSWASTVVELAKAWLRLRAREPGTRVYRARQVRVTSRDRCDIHVDAEPFGLAPADYAVVPGALRALIPSGASASLFST